LRILLLVGIHVICDHLGRPTGDAFVEVSTDQEGGYASERVIFVCLCVCVFESEPVCTFLYRRVLAHNKQSLGHRYVEIFASTAQDLVHALSRARGEGKPFQTNNRSKGGPPTDLKSAYYPRDSYQGGSRDFRGDRRYNGRSNQHGGYDGGYGGDDGYGQGYAGNNSAGPGFGGGYGGYTRGAGDYNSYNDRANGYGAGSRDGGHGRSEPSFHAHADNEGCLKMLGLPFNADDDNIIAFFGGEFDFKLHFLILFTSRIVVFLLAQKLVFHRIESTESEMVARLTWSLAPMLKPTSR
jgi:hypothetical protein